MRYTQTAQESGELLRQVIPYMTQHGGFYTPLHYTLWYEYLAATHAQLKHHIDELLKSKPALSATESEQLYSKYIETRDSEITEKLQHALEDLLRRLGAFARAAGESTGEFSRHVSEAYTLLRGPLDAASLTQVVAHLTEHTQSIAAATQKLHQQIESSSAEISQLREELGQVRSDSLTDPLTKLLNRRGFEQAAHVLSASQTGALAGCTLIMADIDNFKRINDKFGHLIGDEVIKSVAHLMHRNVKGADIVGRFGGEEFVVLLPNTTAAAGRAVAETIRSAVSRARLERSGRGEMLESFTVSIGVACASGSQTLASLIEQADRALYRAKQRGRNCVEG